MNYREMAIVTAYTGVSMFQGEELIHLYEYLSEIYGRPIYTHEMALLNIKEKSKPDFLKLCETGGKIQRGEWVEVKKYNRKGKKFLDCSVCHYGEHGDIVCEVSKLPNFCPACGLPMTDEAVEILKKREAI